LVDWQFPLKREFSRVAAGQSIQPNLSFSQCAHSDLKFRAIFRIDLGAPGDGGLNFPNPL